LQDKLKEQATLKRNIDALNDFADAGRQVVDQLPGKRRRKKVAPHSGVENLMKDFKDTVLVMSFVAKVEEGVALMKQQPPDDRSSSTGDYFNDLVEYRRRQQNEQNDNGKELVTVRDVYTPPAAEEFSEDFGGCKVISLLDLFSGYDQVDLHPKSRLNDLFDANVYSTDGRDKFSGTVPTRHDPDLL
jgi:hypothetical protein